MTTDFATLTSEERKIEALERIATALEQLTLAQLPGEANAGSHDLDPQTFAPSPEFLASRDLPTQPIVPQVFAPLNRWSCPIHHSTKVVPAGVSKSKVDRDGQPLRYDAFITCGEQGCNEKPPR